MTGRRCLVGAAVVAGSLALAACSNSSSSTSTTGTTSAGPSSGTSTTSTGSPSAPASNLPVTDQVRTQLVTAASALQNIPVAQFSGLAPGLTFYGLDRTTGIRWAGARLLAAPVPEGAPSSQAQISTQDEGSYYVFQQPSGGPWTAYAAGNTGPSTVCPVTVPAAVLLVWGWPAGSCRPNGV
jgi:hypothetical protein